MSQLRNVIYGIYKDDVVYNRSFQIVDLFYKNGHLVKNYKIFMINIIGHIKTSGSMEDQIT